MDEQTNILILRYLNGDLSKSEQSDFEERLLNDRELQAAVQDYKQIVQVVKVKERQKLKANIAVIGAGIALKDLKEYKPNIPPPSNGTSWSSIIKSILFFTSIISAACLALIYFNQFPIEHPAVEKIREKLILLDIKTTIRTDTVYQTIENGVITTDTVIYGKEELIEFLDDLEEVPSETLREGPDFE